MDEHIAAVRKKYPTAVCVATVSHLDGEHFRIWPTNGFFERRFLAKARTVALAWEIAASIVQDYEEAKHVR